MASALPLKVLADAELAISASAASAGWRGLRYLATRFSARRPSARP